MNEILKVEDLVKAYGKVPVLKGISFKINEGEIFGLLGVNGAGKSTTLECIEGIKSYKSGIIEVLGQKIGNFKDLHKVLGVQLQSSSLNDYITVYEAMKVHCKWQKCELRIDLLDKFGLKDMYDKKYKQLSVGQKRRLHLAMAISHNPKILILDEPTAGLDVQGRVELHKEIRHLKKSGMTIILASHDMAEIEMLCDRIAIIVKGEVKFIGTNETFLAESKKDKLIKVKTKHNKLYNLNNFNHSKIERKNEEYLTLSSIVLEKSLMEILELVSLHEDMIIDLSIERLSLEERFVEIVGTESEVA